MRLTTRTDLAMRALMYCAEQHPRMLRKTDIARACEVNENHLAQVIHVLGLRGFLQTKRGRMGGVLLARPPGDISVGAVFRALEAEVPFTECFESDGGNCPLKAKCGLKCLLARAVSAFYETLDGASLADVMLGEGDTAEVLGRMMALGALVAPASAAAPVVRPV